jgi:hypothetical protein
MHANVRTWPQTLYMRHARKRSQHTVLCHVFSLRYVFSRVLQRSQCRHKLLLLHLIEHMTNRCVYLAQA